MKTSQEAGHRACLLPTLQGDFQECRESLANFIVGERYYSFYADNTRDEIFDLSK